MILSPGPHEGLPAGVSRPHARLSAFRLHFVLFCPTLVPKTRENKMAGAELPKNTDELLTTIEAEWLKLMDAVGKLGPEQMITPDGGGWSPKDNLAHVSAWLKTLIGVHLEGRSADEVMGFSGATALWGRLNFINAMLFVRNRDRSAEDVLGELRQAYTDLVSRLRAMPFEELMKPRYETDAQKRPVVHYVLRYTVVHFAQHSENIAKILEMKV
jgi:hypothetical protein